MASRRGIGLLLAFLILGSAARAFAQADVIGIAGKVSVFRKSDASWRRLRGRDIPYAIEENEKVRADLGSQATLIFRDNSQIELQSDTTVTISYAGREKIEVLVKPGAVRAWISQRAYRSFTLRTEAFSCAADKAELLISAVGEDKTRIEVRKGVAAVTAADGTTTEIGIGKPKRVLVLSP